MATPPYIQIPSLRGGYNDNEPPNAIDDDQCEIAMNVEFFHSMLGERRGGSQAFDLGESAISTEDLIVHLNSYYPAPNMLEAELMAVAVTEGVSTSVSGYAPADVWFDVTLSDEPDNTAPYIYQHQSQSFDDYWFHAYKSADDTDRLHRWDGTSHFPAGLSEPAAPVVVDTAAGGAYTGVRYFRVRFIEYDNTLLFIRRRSEPSDATTFTPSGANSGALITMPALLGEGETKWEVEASADNANFYRIATVDVGTTTYTDTTADPADYATNGVLSEDIGMYITIPSARYLAVDGDRLLFAGSFEDDLLASRVGWTPVRKAPGVGNSERYDQTVDSFLDLDSFEGGGITGISQAMLGSVYVFKWSHIYKLARTGSDVDAYHAIPLSKVRGALEGSITSAVDEFGRPATYFLDPSVGPCRIGVTGLQQIYGVRNLWRTVNTRADKVVCRVCYYPDKQQIYWWVATSGAERPNLVIKIQISELREQQDGILKRGISLADGLGAQAYTATPVIELTELDGSTVVHRRPYFAVEGPILFRADVGYRDGEESFKATIRSKAIILTGLLNRWGAMVASLLATANSNIADLRVRFIRNFGLETTEISTDLAPEAGEDYVIKFFDHLHMSESEAIQVEFSDPDEVEENP